MRRDVPLRSFAVAAAGMFVLAGCATGSRPTFASQGQVSDPAVEAVLDRLDHADGLTFLATYDITPTSADVLSRTATVSQIDGRREVTIGNIRFVTEGTKMSTCTSADEAATCVDHIDDAQVSDLNLTSQFWARSFADRLRLDAGRDIAPPAGRTETIAGNAATCVDVTVAGGTVPYCALDAGVLGRYIGADVSIELTSFTANP